MKKIEVNFYDLGVIQSNVENMLLNALQSHEDSIIAYGEATVAYAHANSIYRIEKAKEILSLKKEGKHSTIVLDLAKGAVASHKMEADMADGEMKKCKMLCEGFIERIQAIKFIGNRLTLQEKG